MEKKEDKAFDFWNDHSLEFLEMAMKRDHQERVHTFDGVGKKTRECGDTIEFYLMVKDGEIFSISYDIQGCLFSHACANTLIKLVENQTIQAARLISRENIIDYLKTLPKAEGHCADHAIAAFHLALNDYESRL